MVWGSGVFGLLSVGHGLKGFHASLGGFGLLSVGHGLKGFHASLGRGDNVGTAIRAAFR